MTNLEQKKKFMEIVYSSGIASDCTYLDRDQFEKEFDEWWRWIETELIPEVEREHEALIVGCLDYGGGYRGDEDKLEIFHHGIQTCINAMRGYLSNKSNLQSQTLINIGLTNPKPDETE